MPCDNRWKCILKESSVQSCFATKLFAASKQYLHKLFEFATYTTPLKHNKYMLGMHEKERREKSVQYSIVLYNS